MGSSNTQELVGPDFKNGVSIQSFGSDNKILGHIDGQAAILIRDKNKFFAVGAKCTHYGAPLSDGILVHNTLRCPWHHARFDIQTGDAVKAPALNPIPTWETSLQGDKVFVTKLRESSRPSLQLTSQDHFVIVGSGAAGHACAEMLRHLQFTGKITILSADTDLPYDRPNLSKDYLAGNAPEEWMPLRSQEYFLENNIQIQLNARVKKMDTKSKTLELEDGHKVSYTKCLLATGGTAVKIEIGGIDLPHVHFLRSFVDCKKLVKDLDKEKNVVIIGAGFIGLEAAAAMKARGMNVTIVAPSQYPLEHAVGVDVGKFLKAHHEKHGIRFRLGSGSSAKKISKDKVFLRDGSTVSADLVLVATGIKPNTQFAQEAGITVDNGILVNDFLETNAPDVFAAGDVARYKSIFSDDPIRIEHWVVAQRQGQMAALNMMGKKEKYADIPFFWSQQFDLVMNYVGHAPMTTRAQVYGSLENHDCAVAYWDGSVVRAVLTIGRDKQNLEIEKAFEENNQVQLVRLLEGK